MKRHGPAVMLGGLISILVMCLLEGCASRPGYPESILDTPELHLSNGYKLIKMGRFDDAENEFARAIRLDPGCSSAYNGMGLVKGFKKDYTSAFESMEQGKSLARNSEDEVRVYVGLMRLHTMKGRDDWLRDVEKNFLLAQALCKECPEAYYYLGMAYKYAYRFEEAKNAFTKGLEIRKAFTEDEEGQLRIIEKIERARPGTGIGKRIAVQDRITRADAAALFVHECGIDRVYEENLLQKDRNVLRAAGGLRQNHTIPLPPDVANHSLKSEIEGVLYLNIKDLALYPDGTFGPDVYVTRASFAVMVADIIARFTRDPSLAAKHSVEVSPFRDVRSDAPYFNAIMVCRAWGAVIEAENGLFNPMGAVTGYDALFTIRKIKERLNIL